MGKLGRRQLGWISQVVVVLDIEPRPTYALVVEVVLGGGTTSTEPPHVVVVVLDLLPRIHPTWPRGRPRHRPSGHVLVVTAASDIGTTNHFRCRIPRGRHRPRSEAHDPRRGRRRDGSTSAARTSVSYEARSLRPHRRPRPRSSPALSILRGGVSVRVRTTSAPKPTRVVGYIREAAEAHVEAHPRRRAAHPPPSPSPPRKPSHASSARRSPAGTVARSSRGRLRPVGVGVERQGGRGGAEARSGCCPRWLRE